MSLDDESLWHSPYVFSVFVAPTEKGIPLPLREERSTDTMFVEHATAPLGAAADEAADKLLRVAGELVANRTSGSGRNERTRRLAESVRLTTIAAKRNLGKVAWAS